MALVCNLPTNPTNPFTFIDCSTINISYSITGMATVSFVVVSTSAQITLSSYNTLTFGSNTSNRSVGSFSAGAVTYEGIITSYELQKIPGTLVYEHKISMLAWGCRS